MIHTYHGIVDCPICGQSHKNPDMFYVFDDDMELARIICPVKTAQTGRVWSFALEEVRK
jgi:hypothetical protein